ncbi:MAG: hypothetical protein M3373_10630 [Gemmatimonadota bacterium]|nr:hypothetical protein [Gemmatimonadota bacterium]
MTWRAVVRALDDGASFRSKVSLYLHPLGGRPVLWHVLHALSEVTPPPERILVVHRGGQTPGLPDPFPVPLETTAAALPDDEAATLRGVFGNGGLVLLIDGAAPLVSAGSLTCLVAAASQGTAWLEGRGPAREWIAIAGDARELAASEGWRAVPAATVSAGAPAEALRVRDRQSFGEASVALRDLIVRHHQANGVTFVLPATVWVDVDVIIGADTVVYPSAVLEGRTEIGSECVIGPHCRLSEATIGRGVELKGWNYVARTSIRNHAVLEAHVRRGFE